MSTFNKVFCQSLYEKGVIIDDAALKGKRGPVTTGSRAGNDGKNGKLNVFTVTTTANDVKIVVPSAVDSTYDAYQIIKPIASAYPIRVMSHLDVEMCTLYEAHNQEVLLYKRDTEWVF